MVTNLMLNCSCLKNPYIVFFSIVPSSNKKCETSSLGHPVHERFYPLNFLILYPRENENDNNFKKFTCHLNALIAVKNENGNLEIQTFVSRTKTTKVKKGTICRNTPVHF